MVLRVKKQETRGRWIWEHVCDLLWPFSSHVRALCAIRIQPSLNPQVDNSSRTTLGSPTLVQKCPETPDFKELLERHKKSSPALETRQVLNSLEGGRRCQKPYGVNSYDYKPLQPQTEGEGEARRCPTACRVPALACVARRHPCWCAAPNSQSGIFTAFALESTWRSLQRDSDTCHILLLFSHWCYGTEVSN